MVMLVRWLPFFPAYSPYQLFWSTRPPAQHPILPALNLNLVCFSKGALRDKGRKMKKHAAAALQTDLINDDEWEKILDRDGLIRT
jgi:hypothetical protein